MHVDPGTFWDILGRAGRLEKLWAKHSSVLGRNDEKRRFFDLLGMIENRFPVGMNILLVDDIIPHLIDWYTIDTLLIHYWDYHNPLVDTFFYGGYDNH